MTAAQRRAADPSASAWVSASAGAGKTKVLTDRVLNLMLAGSPPERILCLTFTKAAAAEMATRIAGRLARWATMSDDGLRGALQELGLEAPPEETLALARTLFARVLDVPGGMRIQTIHAFCQSVLKRFPLEAGLAPHFTVMDERDAAELMDEARNALLSQAQNEGDDGLMLSLAEVTAHVNEESFARVMAEMARERSRLGRLFARPGGLDAALAQVRARLGLEAGEDAASILAAASADTAVDLLGLRAAVQALAEGSKTDRARADRIAAWLDDPARTAGDEAALLAYRKAYLTKEGALLAKLATNAVAAAAPDVETVLGAEGNRLIGVLERLKSARVAAATEAVLRLGKALLDVYARKKSARAMLDYDDLILTCRDLLRAQGVGWVLYKLDGGIDHVLIDEAQDTNPEQWQVVQALADEFFAGEGAREPGRTVFAVGDPKQSIYSFQRAAPQAFESMRAHFSRRAADAGERWRDVPLDTSFRATKAVLEAVDTVFADPAAGDGVVEPERALHHEVSRIGEAGLVELWPPAVPEDEDDDEVDTGPKPRQLPPSPRRRVAELIAQRIKTWLDDGEVLESKNRPVRPSDILVLAPRRGDFVADLVKALDGRGVPVAGVDRMILAEQLPVMDLIALGRFLLLPEDDLTLATLLKSPLFGLDEEALFDLAHGRAGTLWQSLRDKSDDPLFTAAYDTLADLLARVDYVSPYGLYGDVLGAGKGRQRLIERLGPEAAEPVDEFLTLALTYERSHPPSLEGFLHWVGAGRAEVRRDLEQAERDEVRVMTVHGAKGLEAPIVFLPDTMQVLARLPQARPALLWLPEGGGEADGDEADMLLWPPRAEHEDRVCRVARDAGVRAREREHRRLLYVAMTRAAERLYVCGWETRKKTPDDCWYRMIERALGEIGAPVPDILAGLPGGWSGGGLRYAVRQTKAVDAAAVPASAAASAVLPDWAVRPAPPDPTPPRPLAPSRPFEAEPSVRSPVTGDDGAVDDGARFRRGLLIHRLLQILPEIDAARRADLCAAYLDRAAGELPPDDRRAMAAEVLAVLDSPDFAPFLGPATRAEVPVTGLVGDRVVSGQIDRLAVSDQRVTILDFKSNRPPPRAESEVATVYLRQMAAYRALLREVYPGREIDCALLWTDGPRLMPLSPGILDPHGP